MKITRNLRLLLCAFTFGIATISSSSQASLITLTADLNGAQANIGLGTGSLGSGIANMLFDDVSNEFSWDISWSGLSSNALAAHFHGPGLPNQNSGVQVPIDFTINPTSGSALISAVQATELLAGLWYINIHTAQFGGGEIRGQVIRGQVASVPAPATISLLLLSMIGIFFSRKKHSKL